MARFKAVDMSPRFLPVVLEQQITPGTFEHALHVLIDTEFDLSSLIAKFNNDATGAPAYDPAVLLKIVLLAYSRGIISSRAIERACRENVLFMAISGDTQPAYTTIASFIRTLSDDIAAIFTEVILICDRQGLIGREMFAIDGVKLPANASKGRSGTHAELAHQADKIEARVKEMLKEHRNRDAKGEAKAHALQRKDEAERIESLQQEAQAIREFLRTTKKRTGGTGNNGSSERKSNVTDNDSAKMATGKGVIQGYTGAAAVDATCQIIVAATAHGSGSEQSLLLPMVEQAQPYAGEATVITADAGYHSEANLKALSEHGIAALIADNRMRKRDERFKEQDKHKAKPDPLADKRPAANNKERLFRPSDFDFDPETQNCTCPAGKALYRNGKHCIANGRAYQKFTGAKRDCVPCKLRKQCIRTENQEAVRQVAIFYRNQASPFTHTEAMRRRIDSPEGRKLYGRRIATVEPVFGNLRHNKKLDRFTLRGQKKVDTQWKLYCLVHNIEKLAHHGYR
jgi:transposase